MLVPIAALTFGSFWSESPVSSAGYLTLANWTEAFRITIPQTVPRLFLNSVLFAFLVAFLSVLLGTGMAFLVERTDLPHGKFFEQIAILPRSFPVLIAALAWIMLLSPRIGVLNLILKKTFGLPPLNIYSFPGMVFLMVLYESPIVFLMVLNGFRLLDSSLEEQSLVCGNSIVSLHWQCALCHRRL